MAAGSLAAPGTEYGPCSEPCRHEQCKSTNAMAERPCSICEKPIGFDTPFYQDGSWQVLTHQICSLREQEANKES